jgi:L-lactate dehydrogenase
MKVVIFGTGNVSALLTTLLVANKDIDEVVISGRSSTKAEAILLDAAGAFPVEAGKLKVSLPEDVGSADIFIITAGAQMSATQTSKDVLEVNKEITAGILKTCEFNENSILITLATPVDQITPFAQQLTALDTSMVFGFGGDLDTNRLIYTLRKKGKNAENVCAIGEHGKKAIPIYQNDSDYEDSANSIRNFLSKITQSTGHPRNVSTGFKLNDLVSSIIEDKNKTHYVCGFHPEYEQYLTWGYEIGRKGIVGVREIMVPENAKVDLERLLKT